MTIRDEGARALELRLRRVRMHEERERQVDASSGQGLSLQLPCGLLISEPIAGMQKAVKPSALQVRNVGAAVDQLCPRRDGIVVAAHGHEIDGMALESPIALAARRGGVGGAEQLAEVNPGLRQVRVQLHGPPETRPGAIVLAE